jgi:hypothetical protein
MKRGGIGLVISLVALAVFAVAGMRSAAEHRQAAESIMRGDAPPPKSESQRVGEAAAKAAERIAERLHEDGRSR